MKDLQRIRSVFCEALERGTREEQEAYLSRACRGDSALRAEVETLLKTQPEADDFFQGRLVGPDMLQDDLSEGPGTVIGRYKLLERIGEGGMAVVYMAEQEQPIRRKVALKIIKLGMDTKQVIARFEAERQALAIMDHPNIAKVLDAGATETGRPYFVMDLVTGVSITEYCDKNNLSTKDRLALFIQVCNAVQHAHQKGIIHRDLKPSNVMVTQRDGVPVPKVIDFGIAKATNQKLTEKTLFTRYAHIIGTPAYMSPEQAELSDLDIDTRTDIYSLGVLLYELLTGATPFSEEELRKAGYLEMQRVIREQEPPKPSTKLSTLGETLPDIAEHRGSTPDILRKLICGDLDWIVMKTLEKDRTRRYETANGFGMDVQRHLDSEPVLARGPSATYRLQKFIHRNRVATVGVLAIVAVMAVMGVILSMWNQDRLRLAEGESFRHRNILSQARESHAKGQHAEAMKQISSILRSKDVGSEAQLLYAGILVEGRQPDEAVTMLEKLRDNRPEIAGAAHSLLARILWESPSTDAEKLKKIDEHRRRAEELLPETAEAYFLRAMTAVTIKEKFEFLDQALSLGPSHYESYRLRACTHYASRRYEKMERDAIAMIALRPRDPLGHSLQAIAWHQLGRYEDAIEAYDSAIRFTQREDPQYVDLNARRCDALMAMGQYNRVITEARQCLEVVADTIPLEFRIFCALTALGDYEEAGSMFQRVTDSSPASRTKLRDWSRKYVLDRLHAGQPWHPPGNEPEGVAFMPMLEAQRTYRNLSAKARRVVTDAFTAHWSPDGTKLAFSTGFFGYSGVAVLDAVTGETDLLIVPGKDPRWSSDGRYLAFVRDCQALPVSELAGAERVSRHRALEDEEVWIMRADGTEPRRLAFGNHPCWGRDPNHIYFYSQGDGALCEISIEDSGSKHRPILKCVDGAPEISPDEEYVACIEGTSLKVLELASGSLFAECTFPSGLMGKTWSLDGRELCFSTMKFTEILSGLWVHDLDKKQTRKVLGGPVRPISLAPDGTQLVFNLPSPYFEIWVADLDPNAGIVDSLGPGLILEEHYQKQLALYTQRIEANPEDANNYFLRAQFHGRWGDRASANADMRRWSAVVSKGLALESPRGAPRGRRRIIHMPFDCQLVFSAERPVNTIPMMSVAFGQKGRCTMKLFKIPMFVTSLLGFGLLSGLDTRTVQADYVLGTPTSILSSWYLGPSVSTDGLSLYLDAGPLAGGHGGNDIWVSTREAIHENWSEPVNAGPLINSSYGDGNPDISADGLTLFFNSRRPGYGDRDILLTTRVTTDEPWSEPLNLGPTINGSGFDAHPSVSTDGLSLFFASDRSGGHGDVDVWLTTRATTDEPWSEPVNLGPSVNSPSWDGDPDISSDGLKLFFRSDRPGGYGERDIWLTTRATIDVPWSEPVNLGPIVNSSSHEINPCISADGSILYFWSGQAGGDLRQVPIIPIVDFNGDGQVDGKDLLIMIAEFGGTDALCDIGPTPLGDGVVDFEDLKVLAGHIPTVVEDPTLAAHWALDETEGITAYDMAGENDAMVMGNAAWQPEGGKIGGALAFDGVDDFILANSPAGLGEGPFSVCAWIKDGAPGQAIVSPQGGARWLYTNPIDGSLMTDLSASAGAGTPLFSDVVVTDGQWHRVILVWDGTDHILCVDDEEAAREPLSEVSPPAGKLIIGGNGSLEQGSLWSGLIDDVRVYDRAVKP